MNAASTVAPLVGLGHKPETPEEQKSGYNDFTM